ncbi:protease pro-enzyme activation domain-containing protein [Amycolatopsis sp. cmx-8-4]|uniref:protease pro-enzyme activation domain-containing protein n=1 Tax=Amycolatopsis sp. cmx-8-4 TaxID=2790947 RepID=UPI003979CB22
MSPFPSARRAAAAATTFLTAAALLAVGPPAAHAQNTRVPLPDSIAAPAGAHRDAAVAGDRGVGIAVALRPHDEAGLNRFVAAVGDPRSPGYRHYLTSEQYNARFAPTASDVAQVTDFLRAQGFRVTSVAGNRQVVDATGTADAVKAAFGTSLGDYTGADGAHFYANDAAPSIPAALGGVVRSVLGLSDRPAAGTTAGPTS